MKQAVDLKWILWFWALARGRLASAAAVMPAASSALRSCHRGVDEK